MGLKFLSLKDQTGDASIFLAMILAVGVGTAVYYNMDKLNQTLRANKVASQKERAETRNISGLSQATALMRYSGTNPQSDNAATLPYIYPDPYLPNGSAIGTPRNIPNAPTWTFASMKLEVNSPLDSSLKTEDFAAYVLKDTRPSLTNKSTIEFVKALKDDAANPYRITAYEAKVTSTSFDNQTLTSKATVEVPRPLKPICILRSIDGNTKFQPNTPMNLVLMVSGLALTARIPDTTEALTDPDGTFDNHRVVDLKNVANSVRRINNTVYNWRVSSPRPLVAVDGNQDVELESFAYLQMVDNNSETAVACSFKYTVTAPATCKLWTDKASVPPGQCVNLTSGTIGPVMANSLVMTAVDPTGKPVSGLTQTGDKGKFCTPAVSSYSTGKAVPQAMADLFAADVSKFTIDQQKALYEALKALQKDLDKLFKTTPELLNLSVNQFNDLFSLGPAQLSAMSTVDFSTFVYLKTLTQAQQDALKTLTAKDLKDLDKMKPLILANVSLLDDATVDVTALKNVADFDSALLMAYIGALLDKAEASSAPPVDYKILGTVTDADGTKNSCLVHVTAGTNQCPFYGSQFPNYTQKQTVYVNMDGQQGSFSFDFKPSNPNWEVASIAASPTQVDPCPPNARCYAVDNGGNRTPFVTVDKADTNKCNATANVRIDLGCFEANTKIRMGDGTDKAIRELKDNDLVYNPLRNKAMAIKRVTPGPEKLALYSVKTEDGTVQVTSKHPFLTAAGMKQTEELQAGDRILGVQGERVIQSIEVAKDAPKDWVWNFEFATDSKDPADHAILADGVVTGDLYLQEQLAHSKLKTLTLLKP